jgi:hypothetical protein
MQSCIMVATHVPDNRLSSGTVTFAFVRSDGYHSGGRQQSPRGGP